MRKGISQKPKTLQRSRKPRANVSQQRHLKDSGTIALIILLSMAPPLSTDMYMSSLPTIAEELNTTQALASQTMTVFFLFMALGTLFLGPLSDKYGRKRVLLISIGLSLIFSIACALSQEIFSMLFFRMMNGLGAGGMVAIGTALVRDSFQGNQMGKVLSLTQAMTMIAPMVAPLVGVAILEVGGWRFEFVALALLMLIALIGALLLDETLSPQDRITGKISQVLGGLFVFLKDGSFLRLLFVGAFLNAPYMAYLSIASFAYISFFGVSTTMFGFFFALASVAAVVGSLFYMKTMQTAAVPAKILLAVLSASGVCAVGMIVIGQSAPLAFLVCIMPLIFTSSYARPMVSNVLLAKARSNVGAASSLLNFAFTAVGCVGMVAASFDWGNVVFGLGCIMTLSIVLAFVMWGIERRMSL